MYIVNGDASRGRTRRPPAIKDVKKDSGCHDVIIYVHNTNTNTNHHHNKKGADLITITITM
jgi:hypothetical protein